MARNENFISTFRGYSSVETDFTNPRLTNFALARRDLLNQFGTRLGERIMLPNFGTIIWDLLFDPLNDELIEVISEDVQRIISEDPRFEMIDLNITDGANSIRIDVKLNYIPTQEEVTLPLEFDRGTDTV
jgi:phage baseplate assembly protein W